MPSAFWTRQPLVTAHPSDRGRWILIYPNHATRPPPSPSGNDPLATLLGATRAAALRELTKPCGTGELANRLHLSIASASQHTRVLREAGLSHTRRHGRRVQHSLTSLGHVLVAAAPGNTT